MAGARRCVPSRGTEPQVHEAAVASTFISAFAAALLLILVLLLLLLPSAAAFASASVFEGIA